mgnify:CR=1 FL=1
MQNLQPATILNDINMWIKLCIFIASGYGALVIRQLKQSDIKQWSIIDAMRKELSELQGEHQAGSCMRCKNFKK